MSYYLKMYVKKYDSERIEDDLKNVNNYYFKNEHILEDIMLRNSKVFITLAKMEDKKLSDMLVREYLEKIITDEFSYRVIKRKNYIILLSRINIEELGYKLFEFGNSGDKDVTLGYWDSFSIFKQYKEELLNRTDDELTKEIIEKYLLTKVEYYKDTDYFIRTYVTDKIEEKINLQDILWEREGYILSAITNLVNKENIRGKLLSKYLMDYGRIAQ